MTTGATLRASVERDYLADEAALVGKLTRQAGLDRQARNAITTQAADLVSRIRNAASPGLMEVFLAEYGLSTDEGIALMCLAEALLRVPDAVTIDALIEDKIASGNWSRHLGQSTSPLVNASTWGLMLTGTILKEQEPGLVETLRSVARRLGDPMIRTAVNQAMREMGRQFVLGENIDRAMNRAAKMEQIGFTYSYDMLGEAARTDADAQTYQQAYAHAIDKISTACRSQDIRQNPGISVKLSALHPRYEQTRHERVMTELVPRLRTLALQARSCGMGFTIDAEEADRLSLSLDVIESVVSDPALADWDGFGIVVQAYGQRAGAVLAWLGDLATRTHRRLMVRLVKGAYWDAEIKRAQVLGLEGFPVFTSKANTDIAYIAHARTLLGMTDRLYPQFATHNAHTVAAVLHMAGAMSIPTQAFEFQRLHGMGEELHKLVLQQHNTRCRIYAPVGIHKDLLAYLVRRLLENGANSSFVNRIVDKGIPAEDVAADPFEAPASGHRLPTGAELFAPRRVNARGWDFTHRPTVEAIDAGREPFRTTHWQAAPLLACTGSGGSARTVTNPALPDDRVGHVTDATPETARAALEAAIPWGEPVEGRADILHRVATTYEAHAGELFALLHREAGKTLPDAIGEVREAVDFLRYYAVEAESRPQTSTARGCWVCISPWNFPLAIFTGQIAAALVTGNAVLAKPAEQTCLIAHRAVQLMHAAGVPRTALQLLPGGGEIGAALTRASGVDGVAFTGSTGTARKIRSSLAENAAPGTPLIAETGGLNAMVVDSTALAEHAVRDILQSAFQSAGQRCSALRCLYLQNSVRDKVLTMLKGAMQELAAGDPWHLSTDVGPVIDHAAQQTIVDHVAQARRDGRVLFETDSPTDGTFVAPTLIAVEGIGMLEREIFGPILHIAGFDAEDLPSVLEDINATGYGLTFGLHTRIDDRVEATVQTIHAGNLYINRNQIGAVVGSQPFGGEGLSGTGPKAGGPHYLSRFVCAPVGDAGVWTTEADLTSLEAALRATGNTHAGTPTEMPGPTGESNRLQASPRGGILCLGPGAATAAAQADRVRALGGIPVIAKGQVRPEWLTTLPLEAVLWWGDIETARACEHALAKRPGALVPLIVTQPDPAHVLRERHTCIDTTASGGNVELLGNPTGHTSLPPGRGKN